MSTRANYLKIGLFVMAGSTLLVTGVVILGAGALFRQTMKAETYIQESVQGLDVGSAVKYLGVQVGNVKEISFVKTRYQTNYPYVLVELKLYTDRFGETSESAVRQRLQQEIDRGLRIRIATQALTGAAYLALDYEDPTRITSLPIDWEPSVFRIPSAPSAISRFTESVDRVFQRIESTDIEKVILTLDNALTLLSEVLDEVDMATLNHEAVELLTSLRRSSKRVETFVQAEDFDAIPSEMRTILGNAKRITETSEKDFEVIRNDLRETVRSLREITDRLDASLSRDELEQGVSDFGQAARNVREATEALPDTLQKLNASIDQVSELVARENSDLEVILMNIRTITENLKSLTENAEQSPSQMLFGGPPPRSEVVE